MTVSGSTSGVSIRTVVFIVGINVRKSIYTGQSYNKGIQNGNDTVKAIDE